MALFYYALFSLVSNITLLLCPVLFGVKYYSTLQGDLKKDGPLIVLVHKEQLKWKKNYH